MLYDYNSGRLFLAKINRIGVPHNKITKEIVTLIILLFAVALNYPNSFIKRHNEIYIDSPQEEDVSILVELIRQLGFIVKPEIIEEKIKFFLTDELDKIWVAKLGKQIVGSIAINIINPLYTEKLFARIDTLVVHERYRKLGIGKLLVSVAEEYALSIGCSRIFLTSGNHRTETHKFYEHLGYVSNATYFVKNLN